MGTLTTLELGKQRLVKTAFGVEVLMRPLIK